MGYRGYLLAFVLTAALVGSVFAQTTWPPFGAAGGMQIASSPALMGARTEGMWVPGIGRIAPRLDCPRFFVGISPALSSIKLDLNASAAATWLGDPSTLPVGTRGDLGAGVRLEWKTEGIWFGAAIPLYVSEKLGFVLEGWAFRPFRRTAEMGVNADGELAVPGVSGTWTGGTGLDLDFDVRRSNWYSADFRAEHECYRNLWILAGVRYDYLEGVLKGPGTLNGVAWYAEPGDPASTYGFGIPLNTRLDVNLNSIFPYAGLKSAVGGSTNRLVFVLKGSPLALQIGRDAPYKAYFGELLVDYSSVVGRNSNITIDLFAKFDVAHGVFRSVSDIQGIFNKALLTDELQRLRPLASPFGTNLETNQDLTVHWSQLICGAGVTTNFSIPWP
jgi:hypothetical protein